MEKILRLSLATAVAISVQAAPINVLKASSLSADHGGTKVAIDAYSDGAGALLINQASDSKFDNSAMNSLVFKYGESAKVNNTTLVNEVKVLNTSSSTIEKALADKLMANAISNSVPVAPVIPVATNTCAGGFQGAYNVSIACQSGLITTASLHNGWLNLTSVTGGLNLSSNPALTSVENLANLTSVSGDFYLHNNQALTNLNGLMNLQTVGGFFYPHNSGLLANIDGLSKLVSVGKYLVFSNTKITNLNGLVSLKTAGDIIDVHLIPTLTDISGLSNLISVTNYVYFDNRTYTTKLPASSYLCQNYASKIYISGAYATAITKNQVCNP